MKMLRRNMRTYKVKKCLGGVGWGGIYEIFAKLREPICEESGNYLIDLRFIIIIISNLSNDRSKASSKTIPPHSAI